MGVRRPHTCSLVEPPLWVYDDHTHWHWQSVYGCIKTTLFRHWYLYLFLCITRQWNHRQIILYWTGRGHYINLTINWGMSVCVSVCLRVRLYVSTVLNGSSPSLEENLLRVMTRSVGYIFCVCACACSAHVLTACACYILTTMYTI
jgi:hypothetical protein